MIEKNIKFLRKGKNFTQEELAEKLGVSRQSVAKWESGESLPDIINCAAIARIFDTTIDNLVGFPLYKEKQNQNNNDGRYFFGMVKVGERGQIVIPKAAREIFDINPGEQLIVMGDTNKGGIAVAKVYGIESFRTKK